MQLSDIEDRTNAEFHIAATIARNNQNHQHVLDAYAAEAAQRIMSIASIYVSDESAVTQHYNTESEQ